MKRVLLVALGLLVVTTLAACDDPYPHPRERGAGATTPHEGGTLRLAANYDVTSFDPANTLDPMSGAVEELLFDKLVDFVPGTGVLEPDLAERWEVVDGGRVLRFFLRADAVFSDGSPVTAADVKGSLERMLDPDRGSNWASGQFDLIVGLADFRAHRTASLAGVVVVDAHTVEVHETDPDATALQRFAFGPAAIVPAAHVVTVGRDVFAQHPVGSGPYTLESWEKGTRVTLRKNPHYFWTERTHLDRIVLDVNVAGSVIAMRLQRGDVDLATGWWVNGADAVWFRAHPAWATTLATGAIAAEISAISMNTEMPPWDNRGVRRAAALAIDRRPILKASHGECEAQTTLYPRGIPGHQDAREWGQRHDVDAARAELTKAGYPDGLPGEHDLWAYEEDPTLLQVQTDLARIGIKVRLRVGGRSWSELLKRGVGPLILTGWVADFPDPLDFTDPLFHSRSIAEEGSPNTAFYQNPALDRLLDGARRELASGPRLAMYAEAERIIVEDAPWAFLYAKARTDIVLPYVRGYHVGSTPSIDLRGVWLDEPRRPWTDAP